MVNPTKKPIAAAMPGPKAKVMPAIIFCKMRASNILIVLKKLQALSDMVVVRDLADMNGVRVSEMLKPPPAPTKKQKQSPSRPPSSQDSVEVEQVVDHQLSTPPPPPPPAPASAVSAILLNEERGNKGKDEGDVTVESGDPSQAVLFAAVAVVVAVAIIIFVYNAMSGSTESGKSGASGGSEPRSKVTEEEADHGGKLDGDLSKSMLADPLFQPL